MTKNPDVIRDMFDASTTELEQLKSRQQLSSYFTTVQLLSKSLLLSCASYYEHIITAAIESMIRGCNNRPSVTDWICRDIVEGKFFKWFDFRNASNTNRFLSMFGTDFKNEVRKLINAYKVRVNGEKSFLQLCIARNDCVHSNYAAHSLNMTIDEIYSKHRETMTYIRVVEYSTNKWLVGN